MISVIIPTYNRFELLNRAIDSVVTQTYKDLEIIVVDDCSEDPRYQNLKNDQRIRYIRMEKRTGLPACGRNMGIKNCIGDWVAFLDDDDVWLGTKLEKQMSFSDKYKFISSEAIAEGHKWAKGVHLSFWNYINPLNVLEFDFDLINKHNLIINSSVLVKKELLLEIGLITENPKYRGTEDYHTWKEILKLGEKCLFIEEPLIEYETKTHKYWKDTFSN